VTQNPRDAEHNSADDGAAQNSPQAEPEQHPFASLFEEDRRGHRDDSAHPASAEPQLPPPLTRREARAREAASSSTGPVRIEPQGSTTPPTQPVPVVAESSVPDASSTGTRPIESNSSELRAAQAAAIGMLAPQRSSDGPSGSGGKPPKRKRRRWLTATIVTVVIVGLLGGGGAFAWFTFQPQVKKLLSLPAEQDNDFKGAGTGSVDVTIKQGDIGTNIATTLQKAGVVKTSTAFYDLLLKTQPDPVFQPGVYRLKKQMSSASALSLLQDPKSKLTRTAVIPEGETEKNIIPILAKASGVSAADLQTAANDVGSFGLPSQATSLEGFLFPATYQFNPGMSAHDVLKTLVDRANQAFTQDGVAPDNLWNTVILASVVQKESGPNPDDPGKIARVFQNRLDQGMLLQSDATVAYGSGDTSSVFTTDAQREDASDPYNTYVHQGLPIGPISNPGDVALKAAVSPTPGDWLYFTAVNLQTGETAFSTTEAEHEQAVEQLQAWCQASAANDKYCQ
jgi:UPF0755 protein